MSIVQIPGFGGPTAPAPATPPPTRSDAEVQAAGQAERLRRSKASGRASTILSGRSDEDGVRPVKKLLGS